MPPRKRTTPVRSQVFLVEEGVREQLSLRSTVLQNSFLGGPRFVTFTPPLGENLRAGFCKSIEYTGGTLKVELLKNLKTSYGLASSTAYTIEFRNPSKIL